jgi:hypothetical protein
MTKDRLELPLLRHLLFVRLFEYCFATTDCVEHLKTKYVLALIQWVPVQDREVGDFAGFD